MTPPQRGGPPGLTFDPTGRFAEPPGTNEPPAGLEFVYDEENRVIAVHRDFDGQPGPYQNGQFGPLHDESDEGMHPLYVFKYDALGRRVETIQYVDEALGTRWDDGATPTPAPAPRRIRHVYAGLETIQEYACCTGADACGATAPPCNCGVTATGCGDGWPLAREMVWGDANRFPEPVVLVDFTGAGMPNTWDPNVPPPTPPIFYYYLHDALGSVVALTDNVGRLVERYTYDPYGRVVVEQPHDPDGPANMNPCTTGCDPVAWVANTCGGGVLGANSLTYSAYGNPFRWTGQRYDAVTGTYHFHFRTYSPALGRWLQRDPAGYVDGVNLFEYVRSNPIINWDPLGLESPSTQANEARVAPPPVMVEEALYIQVGRYALRCAKTAAGSVVCAVSVVLTPTKLGNSDILILRRVPKDTPKCKQALKDKKTWCDNTKKSCDKLDPASTSCLDFLKNAQAFFNCIDARERVTRDCFGGIDDSGADHAGENTRNFIGALHCMQKYEECMKKQEGCPPSRGN